MILVNDAPKVLYAHESHAHLGQCDCDCACVLDVPSAVPVEAGPGLWARQSPVYPALLPDGWRVIYNPAGPAGVVVLNGPAAALLDRFDHPARLDHAAAPAGSPPAAAVEAAELMARTGLLRPLLGYQAADLADSRPSTLSVWMHVSEACNLHCPYCYVPKRPRALSAETGILAVDRMTDLAVRRRYSGIQIKYAGGEPTLNFPVVWAIHRHAVSRARADGVALKEVLLTNGVDVTDATLSLVAEAGMKMMVSLDGGPSAHSKTRNRFDGSPTYDSVASTVDRARAEGIRVDISITLTALNLEGAPDAVAFAVERQLPFSLNFYRECHTSQKLAQAVLSRLHPDPAHLIETVRRALAIVESAPAYPVPLTGILDRARLDVPHCYPCSAGRDYLAVDPNGRIAACQMLLEQPWADLSDEDPLAVVQSRGQTTFVAVQERFGCRGCQWRAACSGGCPLLHDTDLHRSYCHVYRAILPELVRLEGRRLIAIGAQTQET